MKGKQSGYPGIAIVLGLTLSGPAFALDDGGRDAAGQHHHGHFMARMMEMMDADGDGLVSEREFTDAHRERFVRMDTDGDGQLSSAEVAAHHEQMRERWREKKQQQQDATPEAQ